ncbi:MAG: hypothetical protein ACWA44_00060 [Thiotrichales bacterium]
MKRMKDLIETWDKDSGSQPATHSITINLSRSQVAKLNALQEMYPRFSQNALLQDMIEASLTELEAQMPYIPGNEVISEDELGDPIYKDVGPSPTYHLLTKKYIQQLPDGETETPGRKPSITSIKSRTRSA